MGYWQNKNGQGIITGWPRNGRRLQLRDLAAAVTRRSRT